MTNVFVSRLLINYLINGRVHQCPGLLLFRLALCQYPTITMTIPGLSPSLVEPEVISIVSRIVRWVMSKFS